MSDFELRYVGAEALPRSLSEFDSSYYFKLGDEDALAINAQFRGINRIGVAVLLLFMRVSGRPLDRISSIPKALLQHISEKLDVAAPSIATLKTIYDRRPTHYVHQAWVKKHLGLKDFGAADLQALATELRLHAKGVASVDDLVAIGCRWLFGRKVVIPSDRKVRDVARDCYIAEEIRVVSLIREAIALKALGQVQKDSHAKREASMSNLEWLKTPPKRHSPSTHAECLEKIAFLKTMGVDKWELDAIPLEKQRAYSQSLQARRPSMTERITEATQTVELVFFLRITLLDLTDVVIYQSARRVSDLVRRAGERVTFKKIQAAGEYRNRLVQIKTLVTDKSKPESARLAEIEKLLQDIDISGNRSHAAAQRAELIEDSIRVRDLLTSLKDLDFEGLPKDNHFKLLGGLKEIYAGNLTELPTDSEMSTLVSKSWKDLVDDPDRSRALRALEACAMMGLTRSLRRGSVWINHSLSFRDKDLMLIPSAEWERDRERLLSALKVPLDPNAFLEPLLKNITAGLVAVAEAKSKGKLSIDEQGLLHLPKLESLPKEVEPKRMRNLIFKTIGDVQFPDLIMEMDAQTNFSQRLLGRRATNESELTALYTALIAHGTEIDAKSVAAMTPGVTPDQVSVMMRKLEASGRLRKANECVVDFQVKHAIAEAWGTGAIGSSDMMALDASKHLFNARTDPRRRTFGVGIYTMVLDQYGIGHNLPIVQKERQSGPAIDSARTYNSNQERIQLSLLAVDTHGYTNVAMAFAKMVGFDLCPQLRDLTERTLYLPRNFEVPESLDKIARLEVSIKGIFEGWDEMLRIGASIHIGRISATVALQRFGSAARRDPVHKAADHLGRLLRTLFLCDFFSNPEFRREIHAILGRGESVHLLQRAIYFGRIPADRGRRRDELIAISGAHTLLTNLVIAWNTHRMQDTVDRWRRKGQHVPQDWLARMGPVHFAHINFRGTFKYGIAKYADMLIAPSKYRAAV